MHKCRERVSVNLCVEITGLGKLEPDNVRTQVY